ncbi:MAG: hypothetical protein HYU56_04325 [Candidatus Aenigmarchaeota archaeon]|nr:hypothetical protein [Candidatus Aenigmarchaeota archaeon]
METTGKENERRLPLQRHDYLYSLTPYDRQRLRCEAYGRYLELTGFTTGEYTARGAWAHTEPRKRTVCILPPERRDPYLPIEVHEILHNLYPDAPEELIHEMAFDKSYVHQARTQAVIKYR